MRIHMHRGRFRCQLSWFK